MILKRLTASSVISKKKIISGFVMITVIEHKYMKRSNKVTFSLKQRFSNSLSFGRKSSIFKQYWFKLLDIDSKLNIMRSNLKQIDYERIGVTYILLQELLGPLLFKNFLGYIYLISNTIIFLQGILTTKYVSLKLFCYEYYGIQ